MDGSFIHLEVVTPEGVFFEGEVSEVSLPGSLCPFQVLRDHAPLISTLSHGAIVFDGPDGEGSIIIKSGFVSVGDNKVTAAVEF